jgi:quinol monooxygenase YgiN
MSVGAPLTTETMVSVTFRLRASSSVDRFLELSADLVAWLERRPGFLRYELFRSADAWTDTMVWSDSNSARDGNAAFMSTQLSTEMIALVEPGYRSFAGERVRIEHRVTA